jgi:hypothetical protein
MKDWIMSHNNDSLADHSVFLYVEKIKGLMSQQIQKASHFYQEHLSPLAKVHRRVRVKSWHCCCVMKDRACAKVQRRIDDLWPWDVKHEGDADIQAAGQ